MSKEEKSLAQSNSKTLKRTPLPNKPKCLMMQSRKIACRNDFLFDFDCKIYISAIHFLY